MLVSGGSSMVFDVDRGPDWMFVRLNTDDAGWADAQPVAESVWAILDQNFTYRVVVELDRVPLLRSYLIGQFILLARRIHAHGGVLRICGLSETNQQVLRTCGLTDMLHNYRDRGDAVMCSRPRQPR